MVSLLFNHFHFAPHTQTTKLDASSDEMPNPDIAVDLSDATSQRTVTSITTTSTTAHTTSTDNTSVDSFESCPAIDLEISYPEPPPLLPPSLSFTSKLQQLRIPSFGTGSKPSRHLQLPPPFDFFISSSSSNALQPTPGTDDGNSNNTIGRRSRSLSNASSIFSNLSIRSSSPRRPPSPGHSAVSTPIPSAPSTPPFSPSPVLSHSSAVSPHEQSLPSSSSPPSLSWSSASGSSSCEHALATVPSLWHYIPARGLLAVSATCTSLRTHLRSEETFRKHLEGQGWDAEAPVRRAHALCQVKRKGTRRAWLHLARTAITRGDILEMYGVVDAARIAVGEQETIGRRFGGGVKRKQEYSVEEKRVIDRLLLVLVDCASEHDKNNFSTLNYIATKQLNPQHATFIDFISSIPTYNWKSYSRKGFILAAYLNQQTIPALYDASVDDLASAIDFWRDGAQKVEKSQSLNNTRAALLYSKGMTAFLPAHLRSSFAARKLSSADYDPLAVTERETIPGLGRAIRRFEDAVGAGASASAAIESLELEGAYWKTMHEECPCTPMHMSISRTNYHLDRVNTSDTSSTSDSSSIEQNSTSTNSVGNALQRSKSKLKSSLASLAIPHLLTDTHQQQQQHDLKKFDVTVSDGGAHLPWIMTCSIDRATGRGRMLGASREVVYEIWVTPWGVMGHKMRMSKTTGAVVQGLGDFVLVWGRERDYVSLSSSSGGADDEGKGKGKGKALEDKDDLELEVSSEPEEMVQGPSTT